MAEILIVAATEGELCGHPGLVCGIGPVEAAAATANALTEYRPAAVLHVGVAGGRDLSPGTLVIGTEAVFVDLAAAIPVVNRVSGDAELVAAASGALGVEMLPIATTAAVGSSPAALRVEAMEGFGVLRACERAGIPAVEIRAISNEIGESDRSRWEVERAVETLADALPILLTALRR